jgi:hypothetical protein
MATSDPDETGRQFLIQLFTQTKGDSSVQVSMFDIGEVLDLDRGVASKVAEELIALQLVEIRTLSGGISISADGSEMVQKILGPAAGGDSTDFKLGDDPVLDSAGCQAVEQIVSEIKLQAGSLGLDFDTLAELMADLRTVDAQLDSSRPKTAIFRECFRSIKAALKGRGNYDFLDRVRILISE